MIAMLPQCAGAGSQPLSHGICVAHVYLSHLGVCLLLHLAQSLSQIYAFCSDRPVISISCMRVLGACRGRVVESLCRLLWLPEAYGVSVSICLKTCATGETQI